VTVSLSIKITEPQYRALAAIAARVGVQVHELIEKQIEQSFPGLPAVVPVSRPVPPPQPVVVEPTPVLAADEKPRDADVRRLHGKKYSDIAIARILQLSAATIANDRKRLGLPSNYRGSQQAST
jgi:hypothetical protein